MLIQQQEAEFAYRRLKSKTSVVKETQIHAGGRGKAGGVKLVNSPEECFSVAKDLIGKTLVTHQTGPEGKQVHKVYVEAGTAIAKEYYLAMLVDREHAGISLMFSKEGGMDIEELAEKHPEKIITLSIDPTLGLRDYNLRDLYFSAGLDKAERAQLTKLVKKLYDVFRREIFHFLKSTHLWW